jgi:hypothetical protein
MSFFALMRGGIVNAPERRKPMDEQRLNMGSGELREQELEQGSQQCFPSSSHVMHKLKEAQIQGSILL